MLPSIIHSQPLCKDICIRVSFLFIVFISANANYAFYFQQLVAVEIIINSVRILTRRTRNIPMCACVCACSCVFNTQVHSFKYLIVHCWNYVCSSFLLIWKSKVIQSVLNEPNPMFHPTRIIRFYAEIDYLHLFFSSLESNKYVFSHLPWIKIFNNYCWMNNNKKII